MKALYLELRILDKEKHCHTDVARLHTAWARCCRASSCPFRASKTNGTKKPAVSSGFLYFCGLYWIWEQEPNRRYNCSISNDNIICNFSRYPQKYPQNSKITANFPVRKLPSPRTICKPIFREPSRGNKTCCIRFQLFGGGLLNEGVFGIVHQVFSQSVEMGTA